MTTPPKEPSVDHLDLIGRREVMLHAYGMMLAFGYIFPGMAFYIRYRHRKSRNDAEASSTATNGMNSRQQFPSTMPLMALDTPCDTITVSTRPAATRRSSATYFIHGASQILTALLVFVLAGFVIANTYHNVAIHRTIGYLVLGVIVVQLGLGGYQLVSIMNALSQQDNHDGRRSGMRILHGTVGLVVVTLGLVQAGLGLNKLYPFAQNPFLVLHIAYYCSIVGWIGAIAVMELR